MCRLRAELYGSACRTTLSMIFKLHLSKPKMAFAMVEINMETECEHFSRKQIASWTMVQASYKDD
jgi:hypothetical protein